MREYTKEYLNELLDKHNNLYHKIMDFIMRGEEPPRALCLEYIANNDLEDACIEALKKRGIRVNIKIAF